MPVACCSVHGGAVGRRGHAARGSWAGSGGPEGWFTVKGDGSGLHTLPRGEDIRDATLSPDGTRIAFTRYEGGGPESFWVSAAGGSNERQLLRLARLKGVAASGWSPDSRRIVFAYRGGIWTIGASGGKAKLIATLKRGVTGAVVWSPRGTRIAFVGVRDDDAQSDIYIVRPDGSGLRKVAVADGYGGVIPSWSPDERRLAFSSKRNERSPNATLYSVDVRTRASTSLGRGWDPAFSPNGLLVLFTFRHADTWSVAVARSDGTGRRLLAEGFIPIWSPDGRQIAYQTYLDVKDAGLFAMLPDGSERHRIAEPPGEVQNLEWSR